MLARTRFLLPVVLCAAFAQNPPSNSPPDPAFAKIPFDRWLTERDQGHFQWTARISNVELANSQRLRVHVEIQVDGNELVKRRSQGELVFFTQFSDTDHHRFQNHGALELKDVTEAAAKSDFTFTPTALVVPGDYRIDIAILDTGSGEHATLQRSLHVAPLKSDPLPGSWRDLPPVEFTEPGDPPDVWFQPKVTGRLHLPLETRRPAQVDVLLNASPSATGPTPYREGHTNNRNLVDLLPALKVVSQMELSQGKLNVSLLDLTRRKVLFTQDGTDPRKQPLDWPRLQPALLTADANKIDVHALEDSRQNAQFFLEQVQRRLGAGDPDRALIVLSAPMQFTSGEDTHRIEIPEGTRAKIFYIRYHALPVREPVASPFGGRGGNRRFGYPPQQQQRGTSGREGPDQLEPLLKPLQPRVFDVYDPEQFRKALADVMKELERL
jgi:hypothetical protein